MGQGYVRNDSSNGIADGNVINAALFDGEFDSLVGAFAAVTGHTHDGTTAEGGPITLIGPAQDWIASASALFPKNDNVYDLGSVSNEIRDIYIDRFAYIDGLVVQETATFAGTTIANLGTVTTVDLNGGTIDGTVIGGSTPAAITGTTITASSGFSGDLTGNVTGNITGTISGVAAITSGTITGITDLAIADGGTGASTAAQAVTNLGFTQTAAQISGYLVPQGGIILWSGSIVSIPSGWALCNGSNGTPDLRNRFIVGAGDTYGVAATGGADTVTLSAAEIPAHTHGVGTLAVSAVGNHTHTFSASTSTASLTGSISLRRRDGTLTIAPSPSGIISLSEFGSGATLSRLGGGGGDSSGDLLSINATHSHTVSGTTSSDGGHTHSLSGATASIGSGNAHENRPPYYALAYIMKL